MNKSLLVLIGLLAVLLLVYLLVSSGEQRELTPEVKPDFLGIDSSAVDHITAGRLGSLVEFTRQADGWYINDGGKLRRAQPAAVEAIARLSHSLAVGEVVSSNPDKQLLFQVDTLTGITVKFYRGDEYLGGMVVGKMGPDFQSTYVRKPESHDVYAAQGAFAQLFSRPPSAYMDKTLLALDPGAINLVEYQGRGDDYSVMLQDSLWRVLPADGEAFIGDQEKIARSASSFANLQFSEFPAQPDSLDLDFSSPDLEIKVGLRDGSEHVLRFLSQGGQSKNFYVVGDDNPEPYVIFEYVVNTIAPRLDELRPQPGE